MASSNYELGPCRIEFPEGSDFGRTSGGVTIYVEETFAPINTDQDGENPTDEYITGTTVTVEGSLAEITHENLAKVFKQEVVGSSKVEITPNVGTSLLSNADVMVIKPYVGGEVSTDPVDFITIHHAGLKAKTSLTYNVSDQRTIGFTATGYPDSSTSLIATFGDTSAT